MFHNKTAKLSKNNNILVVPLDWGLGHATRCIPIIRELLLLDCHVIIAAEKATMSLLQAEFQQVKFIELAGYRVRYARKSTWLPLRLLLQLPRVFYTVYNEHTWLKKVVKKYDITAIISDNRLGLYHQSIPSIYITHQLMIKTGNLVTENIAQWIHYLFINRFTTCWVPDFEGAQNIAGKLSHPPVKPDRVKYIGGLSRFEKQGIPKKIGMVVIISGPEPQRTVFENILLPQLSHYSGTILFVRGLPTGGDRPPGGITASLGSNVSIKNHLNATELNAAMESAEWVISRSGYTTVMDLLKLDQRAILVPTPGQTEQEYLAAHLMSLHYFYAAKQAGFNLNNAIQQASKFPFTRQAQDMDSYKKIVSEFVFALPGIK